MKQLLLFCFSLSLLNAIGQRKKTILVEYFFDQKASFIQDSMLNKKIEGEVLYREGEKPAKVATTLAELLPEGFGFAVVFYILANPDSSKTYFAQPEESDGPFKIIINTPDTLYYSKGNWRKLADGVAETYPSEEITMIETKETKKILGYECTKFVSAGMTPDEGYIFWACKNLPNTLLPFTGLKEFSFGILEVFILKTGGHAKASDIKTVWPRQTQL